MNVDTDRIGFMQGRLSPLVNGRIQAFPWSCWDSEIKEASRINFKLLEWTIDADNLYENPLMNTDGQQKINSLLASCNVDVMSLTGDCFMHAPFWKSDKSTRNKLIRDLENVIIASKKINIKYIVIPLVDNGRIETKSQELNLIDVLNERKCLLEQNDIHIVFESDFAPIDLSRFIEKFPTNSFGINYDIGNSASFGYNPRDEIDAFGKRILNVHVKDRILHGNTVPLGRGDAKFDIVFEKLGEISYKGNYILQTARAADGNHIGVIEEYRRIVTNWIREYGA